MFRNTLGLLVILCLLSACAPADSIPLRPTATPAIAVPPMSVTMVPNEEATLQPVDTPESDEEYGDVNCTHPFYPVADGATWTYAISDGGSTTHTMSVDAFGDFTINVSSADITASIDGQCTQDGIIIMNAPGATTNVNSENGDAAVVAVNVSGVTIPNDIHEGQQWSQVVEVTSKLDKSTIETHYTVIGFENVTVPAGDFYALKVEQSGYVTVFGQKVEMHGFQWFVEEVGVVKSEMDGAPTVELVSYDIPD